VAGKWKEGQRRGDDEWWTARVVGQRTRAGQRWNGRGYGYTPADRFPQAGTNVRHRVHPAEPRVPRTEQTGSDDPPPQLSSQFPRHARQKGTESKCPVLIHNLPGIHLVQCHATSYTVSLARQIETI
jgi:hypothetical protein